LLIILVFCRITIFADQKVDSLLVKLQYETSDSAKVVLLFNISDYYFSVEKNKTLAESYLLEAYQIAEKAQNPYIVIDAQNQLGVFYRNMSQYSEALGYHEKALSLSNIIADTPRIVKTLNALGVVYRRIDDHSNATEYHIKALKMAEVLKDTFNVSVACNSLGNIFSLNNRFDEALLYFNRALTLSNAQHNLLGQAINYNNIGEVYEFKKDFVKAKEYYHKSLELNRQICSDKGIAICYNAIGKIELYQKNFNAAYRYFYQALEIDKRLGDKKYLADSYVNLAKALVYLRREQEARACLNEVLRIAREIRSIVHQQWAYETLSILFKELNRYDSALYYHYLADKFKDSVLNEKNARHIATIQTIFETGQKENEIRLLTQQQEINRKELARQRIVRNALLISLILSIAIIYLTYVAFRTKRNANRQLTLQKDEICRANQELQEQKEEIQRQKEEIEKNKSNIELKNRNLEEAYQIIENYIGKITDSIRYAEKIQKTVFPDINLVRTVFSDTFVLNRPKDIVSGDFYWFYCKGTRTYFALADCTGHGVPGAFMSIIGIELLNQAVNQYQFERTDQILYFLNNELRRKLRKNPEELILKDSMDIALCIYDSSTSELCYSGALIPVFVIVNDSIHTIKPNNTSLGASTTVFDRNFEIKRMVLAKGAWIYLTSDGYLDQLGGERNRKFMRSRLTDLLVQSSKFDGGKQKEILELNFNTWKGKNEQIDDVLVWGIRV
jgi:serine phosphatase RsbU (regulator of sigma subunit)/Tfp pilus assembly protein PilF